MVAHIVAIVTVMVCPIAWIATAMAMVFPIARTDARTTLAATNSKRQHRTVALSGRGEQREPRSAGAGGVRPTWA
jgi:hypothetical protein